MRVIKVERFGGPEVLVVGEVLACRGRQDARVDLTETLEHPWGSSPLPGVLPAQKP